jgi:drug/metabolite transporter (DMT)-like permease
MTSSPCSTRPASIHTGTAHTANALPAVPDQGLTTHPYAVSGPPQTRVVDAIDAPDNRSSLALGVLAALAAALIGSGWQIVSRHGVTTSLGPVELAVLRYAVPALLLAPLWCRRSCWPPSVSVARLVLLVLCGGLPFGLVVLAGVQWAPAAHMGIFMAGCMPLFVALGGWALLGDRPGRGRVLGFVLMLAGVTTLGVGVWHDGLAAWRGDLLFVLAAVMWAVYTLAFRGCGLSPWQGAALVNLGSAVALLPVVLVWGAPRLVSAPWRDVALQAFGQGVMAGVLGLVVYSAAIARLGAARAALSAALVPVSTALGAAWLLEESLEGRGWVALALVVPGVVLASGAVSQRLGWLRGESKAPQMPPCPGTGPAGQALPPRSPGRSPRR